MALPTTETAIRLSAIVRIDPANRAAFEQFYQALRAVVAAEDPGQVLVYERYEQGDTSAEYLFHEAYADEAALLAHLALAAPVRTTYPVPMDLVHYALWGTVSPQTVALLAGTYGEQFRYYGLRT